MFATLRVVSQLFKCAYPPCDQFALCCGALTCQNASLFMLDDKRVRAPLRHGLAHCYLCA